MRVNVTKSFLPPIEEYTAQIKRAYEKGWLTNRGTLVNELEEKIQSELTYTGRILATNNGTIPLQIALKTLAKGGEVITTPFSYVATIATIVWESCEPVFVDIEPDTLTIDPEKIEAAITEKTTCILATHVFGNPCDIERIEKIANEYNLKVIYDAAHCFGVKYKGKSIFEYGDISTCSFHATKLFHTGEGGALFCQNDDLFHQLFFAHNFGHDGTENYFGLGINGKMSELNAGMGLAVLPYLDQIIDSRKKVVACYEDLLKFEKAYSLREKTTENYSYFPILLDDEKQVLKVIKLLNENNIFPRRYFYPSLNHLPYVSDKLLKYSEDVSVRILCLPLYPDLKLSDVKKICLLINSIC